MTDGRVPSCLAIQVTAMHQVGLAIRTPRASAQKASFLGLLTLVYRRSVLYLGASVPGLLATAQFAAGGARSAGPEHAMLLSSGDKIPSVGLGVFLSKRGRETYQAVSEALACGYRHVDTAQLYGNEVDVGKAVRDSRVPREEVWVTSKIWSSDWGYERAKEAVHKSLQRMQLDTIDLMLMHSPGDPHLRAETWRALEDLHQQGKLRTIGVSNFGVAHLQKLADTSKIQPVINQIELSPFLQRRQLVAYCKEHGIALEAYSPLVKAQKLNDKTLCSISEDLGRTPAQVLIRWSLQKGFIPLPKSVNKARIRANFEVFNFELDSSQMQRLDGLECGYVTAWDPTRTDAV